MKLPNGYAVHMAIRLMVYLLNVNQYSKYIMELEGIIWICRTMDKEHHKNIAIHDKENFWNMGSQCEETAVKTD